MTRCRTLAALQFVRHPIAATCAIVAACCVGATSSSAQDPQPRADFATALRELESALDAPAPDREQARRRRDLLAGFIERHASDDAAQAAIPSLRCRLGGMLLHDFDAVGAHEQFDLAFVAARRDATDVRGRALYGLAQAAELAGDRSEAGKHLQRTIREFGGTRYARFAELALRRLAADLAVEIGEPAPSFGPRLDLAGRPRQSGDLAHQPALLAFVSAIDPDGIAEIRGLLATAQQHGLPPEQLVVFVLHADASAALGLAEREQWTMPVLLCEREFLDVDALAFGVHQVPSSYLLGPDGTLLARDLTPRRLREMLTDLSRH